MIKERIEHAYNDAILGKTSFEPFVALMLEYGVVRTVSDFITHQRSYFLENGQWFSSPFPESTQYTISATFDGDKVQKALINFDTEQKPHKFYKDLADAGVVLACCSLKMRQSIYMGPHCEYYIERWDA